MSALEDLFIEIEKHTAFRGHATLILAAREELRRLTDITVCGYCETELKKSDGQSVVLDHIMTCEKRPEKAILDKAFEIEDRLYRWLNHLSGTAKDSTEHYWPASCETCREIKEALDTYNSVEE